MHCYVPISRSLGLARISLDAPRLWSLGTHRLFRTPSLTLHPFQSHFRRYLAERLVANLRAEQRLLHEQAALTIQCSFRRFLAQQRVGRMREEKQLVLRERAAVKIQVRWRHKLGLTPKNLDDDPPLPGPL